MFQTTEKGSKKFKDSVISSLFWRLLERGGNAFVQLAVQIVMARLLAPEEFGALAVMLVFVNLGNVFVQSGLNTALVQTPDLKDADASTVFWLGFGISIVLYVAVFAASPTIASFYRMEYLVWPLRGLALLLMINACNSVQVALVQRAMEFRKIFNSTLVSVAISGVLGVALAASGAGLWALVAQQLAYQVLSCLILSAQISWKPALVFDSKRAHELFGFGWKLLVSGILDQGYQSLSDLIIGRQFSASSLGLVSQGKKYPQALGSMLDGAIQPVMLSAVAHLQDDKDCAKRLVRRALKTSTYLIMPAMTLFGVAAEPLVELLLGAKWLPCVPFLQMYCFTYALLPVHTTNLQALNGMGRSDLFLKIELVKKTYGVFLLLFAAVVLKDVHFMVATYMVTGVISTFVNAWPNRRVLGYSYGEQLRDIAPAFAMSVVAGVCSLSVSLLGLGAVWTILAEAVVMIAVYLLVSVIFKVETFSYLAETVRSIISPREKCGI